MLFKERHIISRVNGHKQSTISTTREGEQAER